MLRNLALICLLMQNAGIIIITKYTFRIGAEPYSQAFAIFLSELLKLTCSLLLELQARNWSVSQLRKSMKISVSNIYMLVPATLYVLQNIAQMRAIRGLSPAVYVTGVQMKVLTAAIFSALLLRKHFNTRQIFSFLPLMFGVALVQNDPKGKAVSSNDKYAMISLLVAVTSSGGAGVLLEMSFKSERESLWVKNVFLSMFSLPASFYAAMLDVKLTERQTVTDMLSGFDLAVWMVIILLALGGLLTALVMKYSGALTKCYAVSLSIIVCTVISSLCGMQSLTLEVCLGSILVVLSVFLYASKPRAQENAAKKSGTGSADDKNNASSPKG